VITLVNKDSMADSAGLRAGDVVVRANGKEITKGAELHNIIGLLPIGERLTLNVVRDGELTTVATTVKNIDQDATVGASMNSRLSGATFGVLGNQLAETAVEGGILVADVERSSPAWNAGLRKNDIIVSANRKTIADLDTFRMAVSQQSVLRLYIIRGSGALFLLLQ
jgi:S1-C subfamily serine protease